MIDNDLLAMINCLSAMTPGYQRHLAILEKRREGACFSKNQIHFSSPMRARASAPLRMQYYESKRANENILKDLVQRDFVPAPNLPGRPRINLKITCIKTACTCSPLPDCHYLSSVNETIHVYVDDHQVHRTRHSFLALGSASPSGTFNPFEVGTSVPYR